MDNYFLSKIALSMLAAAVIGFFTACWWSWGLFANWRRRAIEEHNLVVTELNGELQSKLDALNEANANLQEALASSEASEARSRAADARVRVIDSAHRAALDEKDREIAKLQNELESMRPELSGLAVVQQQLQNYEQQMEGFTTDKDRVLWSKQVREEELQQRLVESEALKKTLEEQLADHRQTLGTWENHVSSLMHEQTAKIGEAERLVNEMRESVAQESSRRSELESQVAALQASLTARNEDMSRLEADAALLSHVRQSMRERQTRIDGLELQLHQAIESRHKTEEQMAALREIMASTLDERARAREAEIARLNEELSATQAKLTERNEIIGKLEADAALLSHVRQSMRERQTRIDGLQLQLEQARKTFQKTEDELAALKAHVASSLDAQGKAREAEIDRLTAELAETRANLFDRNEVIGRLEADAALLSHVRQSMRERQTQIDGLKLQLYHARQATQNAVAAADTPAPSPTAVVDDSRLEELAMAVAEKDRQIQLLEENLMAAGTGRAPSSTREMEALLADLADRDERLAAWESRYEATVAEMQSEINKLQKQVHLLHSTASAAVADPRLPGEVLAAPSNTNDVQARLRLASLRGIQFLPKSAEIIEQSLPLLDEAIEILRNVHRGEIEIAGHTDSWGYETDNLTLSQRRADAVRDYLVKHGVSPDLLKATGYGGSRPIADNMDPDGRFANRRIEFIVRD
jgi:outer membrane protein OmpA-like peptidoglycan-associated protein